MGANVTRTDLKKVRKMPIPQWSVLADPSFNQGTVIALLATPGCGAESCTECSRDLAQICELGHHSGIGQDGFFAPYAVISERGAVVVPDGRFPA
jgi:propanol-preferring alcohol dehydrogenase